MLNKTTNSGKKIMYPSGMKRDSNDTKANLYAWIPLDVPYKVQLWTRMGELAKRGADRYGLRNMDKACSMEELERFKESALRHMMQWLSNEEDEDHAAAIMFNVLQAENVKWRLCKK